MEEEKEKREKLEKEREEEGQATERACDKCTQLETERTTLSEKMAEAEEKIKTVESEMEQLKVIV